MSLTHLWVQMLMLGSVINHKSAQIFCFQLMKNLCGWFFLISCSLINKGKTIETAARGGLTGLSQNYISFMSDLKFKVQGS